MKVTKRWFGVVAVLLALLGGTFVIVRGQAQTCRDINNITVCGDILDEFDATVNGGGYRLRGNVKIGPKGLPPVVIVRNTGSIFDGTVLNENITSASYFHFNQADPNTGTTDFIIGEVGFINDPTGLPLLSTFLFDHGPVGGEVTAGRLFVDTTNQKIFLPADGAVPIFTQRNVPRNQAYRINFLSRVGALSFYRDGGTVNELTLVNAEFNLNSKTLTGNAPINLKLNQQAENPNLRINMRATFTDNGTFSGAVDGFKFALAGLVMEASGVTVALPAGADPATFQAGLVKVLKADNQDVPTLDPTDPQLIFAFSNLKYKNGLFEIGGVEVPVKDWEFGTAFKMTNQTLGIVNENNVQSLQVKSTLTFFGDDSDAKRKVPVILKVGRSEVSPNVFRPVFTAGLQNISPKIGSLTFNLQGAVFSGNAAENFWGIKATSAALQWPAHLGGQTAAGINDFKLGVELDASKNKKFKVALGGGAVSLPPFENQVFRGNLAGTLGVISDTMVITGTGTFNVKLPGNANSGGIATTAILRYGKGVQAPTPPAPPPATGPICKRPGGLFLGCATALAAAVDADPLKEFDLRLSGFSFKIAGFGMTVTNPKGLEDGGFSADNVAASLPAGIVFDNIGSGADTNGITIQGIVVNGLGNITIQGGGFEIAPIKFGGYQFVGLKGTFIKLPTGGFEFRAGGKLPLPGIEPGANGGGIGVDVSIRTKPDNSVDGFGVVVSFTAGGAIPKIKLPSTGMSIVQMSGSFDMTAGQSTIAVTLTATSDLALPLGSLGSIPIAKAVGNVTVQPPPNFRMSANAKLSILIFDVAQASVGIGQGYGFNGGPGLNVSFTVNTLFVDGAAHLTVGEVTLSNGTKKIRVQGDASVTLKIPKKIFAGLPREEKILASVNVGFGQFNDTKNNRQTAGLLVMGNLPLVGSVGGFLDMGVSPIDVIFFTNANRFQAVPAAVLRRLAREGVAGYGSRLLSAEEIADLGLSGELSAAGATGILQDTIPHELEGPTRLMMGIEYTGTVGASAIRLRIPGGAILTKDNVNGTDQGFTQESDAEGGVMMFVLQEAVAGAYQLIIDNPPADYTANILELDQMPSGSIVTDVCNGANVAGVTVTCTGNAAAAGLNAADAGQVTFSWTAEDIDTPNATVDIGFAKVISGSVDNATFTALIENQPLGNGNAVWDLSQVPTGEYRVMIEISNNSGPAIRAYGSQLISVVDQRAPAVPSGVVATSLANELSIRWTQNSERDLAGYEIGLGVVEQNQADSVDRFFYSRNMGPKEVITGTANLVDAKLWGIPDNAEVFFGMRSFDSSGNYSAWTPLQRGRPWALSPNTWTPTPNGVGTGIIEVAFDTPMDFDSLQSALTVKNSSGAVLTGNSYFLTDDSGNIIGLGFEPDALIQGTASATVKGGASGVKAVDGRTMGGDYAWTFTLQPNQIYLPSVTR